jgi:hypothetical protein
LVRSEIDCNNDKYFNDNDINEYVNEYVNEYEYVNDYD